MRIDIEVGGKKVGADLRDNAQSDEIFRAVRLIMQEHKSVANTQKELVNAETKD